MSGGGPLLGDLRAELAALRADLRGRLEGELPEVTAELRAEHREAVERQRTAAGWTEWLDEQATQAAVAWVLGTVFVRFCEDNRLVEPVWLAGPPERRSEALDAHNAYIRQHPERNDRHWLREAFGHLRGLRPTAQIFDGRNPLWRIPPSADAAGRLVEFWRRVGEDGHLAHDLTDPALDTRFLGDLYQYLSEEARKRYALLQTPEFVEEFILDRTLSRAIEERGFEGLKLIDPACGSGHFLLGAFKRLIGLWQREAPGMDPRSRVQRVLDSIYGVDVNPFAVAIAEFRLAVAALRAGGDSSFEPGQNYTYHLAVGDSLLHGGQLKLELGLGTDDAALSGFAYAAEDLDALREILTPGAYDVVVANPPYIKVKDRALNDAYRDRYLMCKGKYTMAVPFCQRLFELARPAGWVGQITSNSFMKREFGERLIEHFLSQQGLVEVIDTTVVALPGHNIPTAILIGRNQPADGGSVRAVLGIRGRRADGKDPANGLVWRAIVEHVDTPGAETPYFSVADVPQEELRHHPWSLSGGGARELKDRVELAVDRRLGSVADSIGITAVTGEDDLYLLPDATAAGRVRVEPFQRLVSGDDLRDWTDGGSHVAAWMYDSEWRVLPLSSLQRVARFLWMGRAAISHRKRFGTPMLARGLTWYEWQELYPAKLRRPLTIAFPFVATHNHFVLDRGGKVFKQTAPVIKLPSRASVDDHLRLLGPLNSSTGCFWIKQVASPRGGDPAESDGGRVSEEGWDDRVEVTSTRLEQFPLPKNRSVELPGELDALAQELQKVTPAAVCAATPTRAALDAASARWCVIRARMIALQEELDWQVYRLYNLMDEDLTYAGSDLPALDLGERAFEIVLARRVAEGEEETAWFERHGSTPILEIPAHWPAAYRELVQRRIDSIEERPDLALIERPEYKRRWATDPKARTAVDFWQDQESKALRAWLLDRLEAPHLWRDRRSQVQTRSVQQLADVLAQDAEFISVLQLYLRRQDYHLPTELTRLLIDEAVPFLAAWRYRDTGLRKRAEWVRVWDLQRREDRGETVGTVEVPPKYALADFARPSYWQHRKQLDVPRERFISYPGVERDANPSPVFGWAGWDHLQQAMALAALALDRRQREGWPAGRLTPLLAGIAELEPWLHQWHADQEAAYGGSPAAYVSSVLDQELATLELTRERLAAWRPEKPRRGGRSRRATTTEEATA